MHCARKERISEEIQSQEEYSLMSNLSMPVAHIDDPSALSALLTLLREVHGPTYEFAVGEWGGEVRLIAPPGAVIYRFLIATTEAMIHLQAGDSVRGPSSTLPSRPIEGSTMAEVTVDSSDALWPGDVITANDQSAVALSGSGRYFEVTVEATAYDAPRVAFLRNLPDHPGGCAAYPGAFRREAIPPQRPAQADRDQRGVNRINEHTLDMRIDRKPTPIRHYHGPVQAEDGAWVNHSETALILPRGCYGLPEVAATDEGHLLLYPQPAIDPTETVTIPVRPGSIVVTTATSDRVMGHAFENCFAMLIAIPGFVAPYHLLEKEAPR